MDFGLAFHFAHTWFGWVGDLALLTFAVVLFVRLKRKSARKSRDLTHSEGQTHH